MKKRILSSVILLTMLTGCSTEGVQNRFDDYMENKIKSEVNLEMDQDYSQYSDMKKREELDENGYYYMYSDFDNADEPIDTSEEIDEMTGSVHVTISDNSMFKIDYYQDKERKIPVTFPCRLNPGDYIYATEPESIYNLTSNYKFSCFKLWECDETGNKTNEIHYISEDKYAIKIPNSFTGTELAVEAQGVYTARVLNLKDYFVDESGKRHELNGIWRINNAIYDEQAEIESTRTHVVEYEYDSDEYYLIKTNPSQHYGNEEKGKITFDEIKTADDINKFEVELHHFSDVYIEKSKYIKTVKVNSESCDDYSHISKLKKGDILTIDVDSEYTVECTQLEVKESEKLSDGLRYVINIDNTSENKINIEVYKSGKDATTIFEPVKIDNAEISVKFDDASNSYEIKKGNHVDNNQKVIVTITPKKGYYVTGSNVNNDIYQDDMKFKEYAKNIDTIIKNHVVKKEYTVNFDTKDEFGAVVYKLDGKEVSGKQKVREEQELTIEYSLYDEDYEIVRPSEGWGLISGYGDYVLDSFFEIDDCSKNIDINSGIDGKTIRREDYISIVERG